MDSSKPSLDLERELTCSVSSVSPGQSSQVPAFPTSRSHGAFANRHFRVIRSAPSYSTTLSPSSTAYIHTAAHA